MSSNPSIKNANPSFSYPIDKKGPLGPFFVGPGFEPEGIRRMPSRVSSLAAASVLAGRHPKAGSLYLPQAAFRPLCPSPRLKKDREVLFLSARDTALFAILKSTRYNISACGAAPGRKRGFYEAVSEICDPCRRSRRARARHSQRRGRDGP